jgi:adenylate cyclase
MGWDPMSTPRPGLHVVASEPPGEHADGIPPMSERWAGILAGQHPLAFPFRAGRRFFGLLPSPWRCKFCNAPFRGPYAGTVRRIGYSPSRKNPQICARCIERAPEGGAVVPLAILFADVRGYTTICEQLPATEVHEFLQRFYETASGALLAQGGLLGQIAGDEVMALFVPGIAGPEYRRKAVEASRSLARAVRYTDSTAGSLEIGIGVASGEEFVGNVGGGGYKDFTAVGDVTNTAARLTAVAHDGEIIIDAPTYEAVARAYPDAAQQQLTLKGKRALVTLFRIPP